MGTTNSQSRMLNSVFDILLGNARMIVYSDVDSRTIYTWNKAHTFQAWTYVVNNLDGAFCWDESDILTINEEPDFILHKADQIARSWHQKRIDEAA